MLYKTQQNKILELLKNAGTAGVNSYDLTYIHSIKQAPTRVKELRSLGYNIISRTNPNRSVNYYLLDGSQPQEVKTSASNQSTVSKKKTKKEYFSFKVDELKYDPNTDTFYYSA